MHTYIHTYTYIHICIHKYIQYIHIDLHIYLHACVHTNRSRIPDWFLRLLAPICARSLASLINFSLGCSYVPLLWKMAVIHSVPKIKTPVGPSDYRPMSVVPILSRVVERLVVSTYLYPALMKPPMVAEITDQFAFRP